MILRQKLDRRIGGYWDGGMKDTFDWHIDTHWSGTVVSRVGSWGANYYFDVYTGKTDKATLGNARRSLRARAKADGIDCEFEYIED